jgi:CBS domain-containing protein
MIESQGNTVQSIMTSNLVAVNPETPIIDVSRLMLEKKVRCVLVCDGEMDLLGIVTDSDLVFSVAGKSGEALQGPISQIMTEDPVAVDRDTDIYDVVAIMSDRGFRRVPIVDGKRAVGIVSIRDIVRSILATLEHYSAMK